MAKKKITNTFLDLLFEKNLLSKEDILAFNEEARKTGVAIEDILLRRKSFSENDIFFVKGEFLGIPYRAISEDQKISPDVLREIPQEVAENYEFVPLNKRLKTLEIGMVNPEDLRAKEALKFIAVKSNLAIRTFLITAKAYREILNQYASLGEEITKALEKFGPEEEIEKIETKKPIAKEELERIAEEAPITKMVSVILRHAVDGKASDIHIEPLRDNLRVRFRMDGILYTSLTLPINVHSAIVSRIKILSNLKIDETRIPQDGRFHARIGEKEIDLRVSTFPTASGEKVAMRILDPEIGMKSFEDLGLSGRNFNILKKNINKPYGLILITGPTGSGKSTTLYTILQQLDKEKSNIISLEDPVEYYIPGVNQSQIKPEIGYDFATGLRHILRQDPNVIMVGEIRDKETAALAIHAALTGHLVFSTLHTNNAVGVIPRLIDMGVDPFLIAPTLRLAIAQRLVRKLCSDSKKAIPVSPSNKELIRKTLDDISEARKKEFNLQMPETIYEPEVSPTCPIGTKGRIAVFEILEMTSELEKIILAEPSEVRILEEAKRQGMTTMWQDGIIKTINGIISIEDLTDAVVV